MKTKNTYPNFYSCLKEIGQTTNYAIDELHSLVKEPLRLYFNSEFKNLANLVKSFEYEINRKAEKYSGIIFLSSALQDTLHVSTEKYVNQVEIFSARVDYPSMYKRISPNGNGELSLKIKGLLGNIFTIKPELSLSSGRVNGNCGRGITLVPGPSCNLNPKGKEFQKLYYEGENLDNLFKNIPIILKRFQSLDHKEIFSLNYSDKEKFIGKVIHESF